uniref:E3 ubiquitin-protein ligase TRIM33 n=1 Tax=Neogobius melanostomus TaxID=47308 RepID=A0A8C6TAK6_9GOBI
MSPPATAPAATPVPAPINLLDTCAVCKQSLQSRDCEPKLLPCLHSFCLKCIPQPDRQVSVQVPGPHGQTDTHIVNVMRCSVCLQDYKQLDIIDNYFVKDTSEAATSSDEKSAQVCTSCEDNAGTIAFCVECGEWLCKTCVEAHQRVKITKDHTIRTKEDANTESVGTSGQRPVFCPIHKQEHLKLFCETCDTLTCRDCQLLEHKEHRYQFLEEAFQNQKGMIEATMSKLQDKKNYVHFTVSQVQNRLKELSETHKKVEHEIKIAVFTLINEINKKGKSLLQQLEGVTKERSLRLVAMHKDTTQLAHQIHHVLNFCHWAITTGSSTALLYSNLVIEKPPPVAQPQSVVVGGPPLPPGQVHSGKHPGQINLAQLRLQHMQQQAAFAQKHQHQQQQQQQHQQQQQQMQQMRLASQMSQQHTRQGGPGRMPAAQPRHNGQPYPQMMQSQLQRQHSNPGHAGPFPVASLHNANPTSPTSASMAGPHTLRGPASPILGPIELIPSVTNPENLPCVSNALTPARPSSTSSTGSRGSCSSSGRAAVGSSVEQVRVKQEPGTEDAYSCTTSVKSEKGKDGRSACMVGTLVLMTFFYNVLLLKLLLFVLDEQHTEQHQLSSVSLNGSITSPTTTSTTSSFTNTPLTNGNTDKRAEGGATAANQGSKDDDPNEDWCAVCINGGDLLCCDRCPKVFHMRCHVPTIKIFPKGDFLCTFCRSLSIPEIQYCEENRKQTGEQSLSPEDQRVSIFLTIVPNYYKIIKQPMDLKKVKKKLQVRSSQFYQSTQEFVSDMRLVFKNCAQYNEMSRIIQVYDEKKQINDQAGSEMAISGKAVGLYFEEKLLELFPGQTFPNNPEPETVEENQNQEDSEDSEDDFVQPRRKRLKTDEKVLHIK